MCFLLRLSTFIYEGEIVKMPETNEQARLRLFLQEYERVCMRYSLIILAGDSSFPMVFERLVPAGFDDLPVSMEWLKKGGINA